MTGFKSTGDKTLFQTESSPTLRLLLCAALALVLMWLDHRHAHLDRVRQVLSVVVYPVRAVVDLPFTLYDSASEALATRSRLLSENQALREQQRRDAVRLQRLEALEQENARLRELLRSSERLGDRVLVAQIMRVDLDPFRHRVVLDRGRTEEVFVGQALVDAAGVMGQVVQAGPYTSEAILITDADHAVPVEVNRNGLRTIALGTGDLGRLQLPFLANNADIRAGDLLVTSGLGGTFPRGYPVARVSEVARDPGQPFAHIQARPEAALDRSREVLLVWTPKEALPAPASAEEQPGRTDGGATDGGDADSTVTETGETDDG